MAYILRFVSGKHEGEIIPLRKAEPITLGRDAANQGRLKDRKLSRVHCQLELTSEGCQLADLHSTNGTFVNGQQIDRMLLKTGDEVMIGLTKFRFEEVPDEPEDAQPAPPQPPPDASGVICEECGRTITQEEIQAETVRHVGSRYYCAQCAASFAGGGPQSSPPTRAEPEPPSPAEATVVEEPQKGLDPGEEVGGNRVLERLAQNAVGAVYKAEQLAMHRNVVLKVLHGGDEKWARRYLERVYFAGRLVHPNVVLIHDAGEEGDLFYFTVEYVEGEILSELLEREGSLKLANAFPIITQIGYALEHALEREISHGGLAPHKVFVTKRNVAKVADFGLIHSELEASPAHAFPPGDLPYRPPEQIKNPKACNFPVDVYSAGAIFYHLLAGRPPFTGDDPEQISRAIRGEPPTPISELVRDLPPAAQRILDRSLAKRPEARYQMPKEFLYDLEEVLRREI